MMEESKSKFSEPTKYFYCRLLKLRSIKHEVRESKVKKWIRRVFKLKPNIQYGISLKVSITSDGPHSIGVGDLLVFDEEDRFIVLSCNDSILELRSIDVYDNFFITSLRFMVFSRSTGEGVEV